MSGAERRKRRGRTGWADAGVRFIRNAFIWSGQKAREARTKKLGPRIVCAFDAQFEAHGRCCFSDVYENYLSGIQINAINLSSVIFFGRDLNRNISYYVWWNGATGGLLLTPVNRSVLSLPTLIISHRWRSIYRQSSFSHHSDFTRPLWIDVRWATSPPSASQHNGRESGRNEWNFIED